MNDDRSLERAARTWIEAGPTEAPEHAVERALLLIETTPQERDWHVPWRTRPMTQMSRLLAGVAAIAILLAGGALILRPAPNNDIGRPSPTTHSSPSTTPSPSAAGSGSATLALTETFTSTRHGYSVRYPAGWAVTPATKPWSELGKNLWGSGMNDELSSSTVRFSGASRPLDPSQTADQWLTAYAGGGSTSSWPTVSIGGQSGRITYDGGPAAGGSLAPGAVMYDAVIVVGRRGYNFNMDGILDRRTFEGLLSTVTFESVPALTQTYTSSRHGFTVRVPASWTVTPATLAWPAGTEAAAPPDPMLDVFEDPADASLTFAVVSQPLAADVTPEAWLIAYEKSAPSMPSACWPPPDQMEHVTDGGRAAWIHGGLAACGFTEAIAFAGGRVYEFSFYVPAGGKPVSRPMFDAVFATVVMDPTAANDKP
jgi:hypothetical protein